MLREDVYCGNYKCNKYEECEHSTYAIPIDGKDVLCVNLENTEFCEKHELS